MSMIPPSASEEGEQPLSRHKQVVQKLQEERQRPRLIEIMVLIAGLAISFKVLGSLLDENNISTKILAVPVILLGGLSVFGPILLTIERIKRRNQGQPWDPGRFFWFSTGVSAWITWPPVIASQLSNKPANSVNDNSFSICMYIYGTPLMALYMTIALLAGGWLGRSKSKPRSWQEVFGLLLGLAWACTGMWVVYLMYFDKVR